MAATSDTPRKGLNFRQPGGKEALLVGGVVLAAALIYFWMRNRKTAAADQASAQAASPTALFTAWIHDHNGSSTSSGNSVTVPNVVGMTDTAADAAVIAAGLKVKDLNEKSGGSGGTSKVVSQSPAGGTLVKPGSTVNLTLATKSKAKTGGGDSGEG